MGSRNFGALGSGTNSPPIDLGTLARTTNKPPGLTASAGGDLPASGPPAAASKPAKAASTPALPSHFDVTRLLDVYNHLGWTEAAGFLRFWLASRKCVALEDPRSHKSTIGVNLTNDCMRIYTVSWDWLFRGKGRGFNAARAGIQAIEDPGRLFNEVARNQIRATYGQRTGDFGGWLHDGMQPRDFVSRIAEHQLQRTETIDGLGKDDFGGSVAKFSFYVFYKGETIPSDRFQLRLRDLNGSPWMSRWLKNAGINLNENQNSDKKMSEKMLKENLKVIQDRLHAVIIVKAAGIYLGDIYEFNGPQYLGTWDLAKLDVSMSVLEYIGLYREPGPVAPDDQHKIVVGNETFRTFRDKTGKGGDFLVFSPVKLVPTIDTLGQGPWRKSGIGSPVIPVYR